MSVLLTILQIMIQVVAGTESFSLEIIYHVNNIERHLLLSWLENHLPIGWKTQLDNELTLIYLEGKIYVKISARGFQCFCQDFKSWFRLSLKSWMSRLMKFHILPELGRKTLSTLKNKLHILHSSSSKFGWAMVDGKSKESAARVENCK